MVFRSTDGNTVGMEKETITVTEARKILGLKASKMTDEQINQILRFLYSLCYKVADQSRFQNSTNHYDN